MRSEIGHIARMQGDFSQTEKIYRETIILFQDMGNRPAVAHQLECFASIAIAEEEPQRAAKLLGAAEALRERINSQMAEHEHAEYDQSIARWRATIVAETEFNTLWAEGRAMTMEQAIQLALK